MTSAPDELPALVAKHRPELLILDCESEALEGPDALRRLFSALPRAIPLVLLSVGTFEAPLLEVMERQQVAHVVAKHGAVHAWIPVIDERELLVTCEKLIRRNIFGIEKYIGAWGIVFHRATIRSLQEKASFLVGFESYLRELETPGAIVQDIVLAADELIVNAVVHAPRDDQGRPRYEHLGARPGLVLEPAEYVEVAYACDGQRLMLSVSDNFGALGQDTVQRYLLDRARSGEALFPEDKPGGAGLGLALTFRNVHQLVLNVHESRRTEVIAGWQLRVGRSGEFRQVTKSMNFFWVPGDSRPPLEPDVGTSLESHAS